jgi:hypothetical protein
MLKKLRAQEVENMTAPSRSRLRGMLRLPAAEHTAEFPPYGVFFVLVGVAQIAWAALVVLRELTRPLLFAALANALVVLLYVASRTTGLPIGPQPWVRESLSAAGIAASAFEAVVVSVATWLLLFAPRRSVSIARFNRLAPLVVASTTVAALVADFGSHAHA